MTPPCDESPSFFARTNFRNKGIPVGIKQADRLSHMYVIGKTGTGKSTLLETLASQGFVARISSRAKSSSASTFM